MDETAARFNKQVTKLGRDVKAWPVWGWLKDTIEAFKKTMPLITDLRNPAMRARHWQQLMEHINTKCVPTLGNLGCTASGSLKHVGLFLCVLAAQLGQCIRCKRLISSQLCATYVHS
jgi:hypothetical protein